MDSSLVNSSSSPSETVTLWEGGPSAISDPSWLLQSSVPGQIDEGSQFSESSVLEELRLCGHWTRLAKALKPMSDEMSGGATGANCPGAPQCQATPESAADSAHGAPGELGGNMQSPAGYSVARCMLARAPSHYEEEPHAVGNEAAAHGWGAEKQQLDDWFRNKHQTSEFRESATRCGLMLAFHIITRYLSSPFASLAIACFSIFTPAELLEIFSAVVIIACSAASLAFCFRAFNTCILSPAACCFEAVCAG